MARAILIWHLLLFCGALQAADRPTGSADRNGLEPEQVFLAYIHACQNGKLEEAAGYIWLKEGRSAKDEAPRFREVRDRIERQQWQTRIMAKAVDLPYAAIVFSSRADLSNPKPIFLLQVDGVWKLHHMNVSGGLRHRLPESEMDKVSGLLRWGNQKTSELMAIAQRRANAREQEQAD